MAYQPRVKKQAALAIREAAAWYENQATGQGAKFYGAVVEAIERAAAHPDAWSPSILVYRKIRVKNYPYFVYYIVDHARKRIVVAMIWNEKRHPGDLEKVLS